MSLVEQNVSSRSDLQKLLNLTLLLTDYKRKSVVNFVGLFISSKYIKTFNKPQDNCPAAKRKNYGRFYRR